MISEVECIDNMLYMTKFPDGFFDLGLLDPNWGIRASRPSVKPNTCKQSNGKILNVKTKLYTHKDWDDKPADKAYFDEVIRVTKNQIIFGVEYYHYKFKSSGRLVWDKLNGETDQMGCEIAYCSLNNRTDMVYYMWSGMFQGIYCGKDVRKALVQQGNKKLNEPRIHETQKPIILYKWILNEYAKEGDKILDTHMGSQSSRIASYEMGFDYWGCENDLDHFENGNKRFDESHEFRQKSMFTFKEQTSTQTILL